MKDISLLPGEEKVFELEADFGIEAIILFKECLVISLG